MSRKAVCCLYDTGTVLFIDHLVVVFRQVNITPKYPYHKKIATFCFMVVLC